MATAGDIITLVKTMGAMDIAELGEDTNQTSYLIIFINRALKELAHIAYQSKISDVLNITADGDQTFKRSGTAISDLYAPLRILNSSNTETQKRTSYSAPIGWYRESSGSAIHTKGLSGNHTLHYIAYPASVTDTNSVVEFPEAGLMGLAYYVLGIARESRNAFEESQAMYDRAWAKLKIAVQANIDARGASSGGFVPSINTIDTVFRS